MSISFFVFRFLWFRFFAFFFCCCFYALSYIVFISKIVLYKCDFIYRSMTKFHLQFSATKSRAPERSDLGGLRYCTTALAHSSLIDWLILIWNWIEYNYNNKYRSIFNCPLSCVFINISFFFHFLHVIHLFVKLSSEHFGIGIRTCFLVNGRTVETVETVEQ